MKEKNELIPLDSLDRKLLYLRTKEGRMPLDETTQNLDITAPTVRARMKDLIANGVLKIAGLVDVIKI